MKPKTELFLRKLPGRICVGFEYALSAASILCLAGGAVCLLVMSVDCVASCVSDVAVHGRDASGKSKGIVMLLMLAVLAALAGISALIDVTLGERNREKIAELEEEMEACPARLVKIEDLSPGGSFDPAAAIEEHERRAWRRVEENDRRRIEKEKAERER